MNAIKAQQAQIDEWRRDLSVNTDGRWADTDTAELLAATQTKEA